MGLSGEGSGLEAREKGVWPSTLAGGVEIVRSADPVGLSVLKSSLISLTDIEGPEFWSLEGSVEKGNLGISIDDPEIVSVATVLSTRVSVLAILDVN